jgi:integrase
VAKRAGKVRWTNLRTPDRQQARLTMERLSPSAGQNGNFEVEIYDQPKPQVGAIVPNAQPRPVTPPQNPALGGARQVDPVADMTLRGVLDAWQDGVAVAQSTKKRIGYQIKMLERHLSLDLPLRSLDTATLRKLQADLRQSFKVSTTNDLFVQVIRPALDRAVERGWLPLNPAAPIANLRKTDTERLQPAWEDAQRLVDRAEQINPQAGRILKLMLLLGLGQAEVQGLKGEHLDLKKGKINIRRKKTGRAYEVPIYPHARDFVERLREEGSITAGKVVLPWQNIRHTLESACEQLSMPRYSARALRRTLIIHLIEEGIDVRQIAAWQGHKDATLILKVYGPYLSAKHTAAQMALLEKKQAGQA